MYTCSHALRDNDSSFLAQAQSTNTRGHRSVDAIKAKRKRYRERKKNRFKVSTPVWKSLFEKHLCTRWKERYETQQIEDDQHDHDAATQYVIDQQIVDIEKVAKQHNEVEKEYNDMSVESTKSNSALLLPSVIIPIEDKEPFSYAPSVISHMEQQCIIKQATTDRDQALMEAKYYRNLAETFKTEKRDMEQAYANRVEVVRDFWRNKIVEGDS